MSKRRAMVDVDMNSAYINLVPKVENSINDVSFKNNKDNRVAIPQRLVLQDVMNISPSVQNENYYRTPGNKDNREHFNSQKSAFNRDFQCSDSFNILAEIKSQAQGKLVEHKRGRSQGQLNTEHYKIINRKDLKFISDNYHPRNETKNSHYISSDLRDDSTDKIECFEYAAQNKNRSINNRIQLNEFYSRTNDISDKNAVMSQEALLNASTKLSKVQPTELRSIQNFPEVPSFCSLEKFDQGI